MSVDAYARVLELTDGALRDASDPSVPTSAVLDKATRIARLRRDGRNLIWLLAEARTTGDEQAKARAVTELRPYFETYDALRDAWSQTTEALISERSRDPTDAEASMLAMSVREIEVHIQSLGEMIDDAHDLPSERAELILTRSNVRQILSRVRTRIQDYLSQTEAEIVVDHMLASIFEKQRIYVDRRLREISPEAFEQLASAYRRRAEGDAEARTHALTSCRRALKSVADAVYPCTNDTVVGADGQERKMTDQNFISRLLQFAHESRGTASDLLGAQISELAAKLDALNALDSKGVHARVSEFDVDQAVLQTYMTIADILRLSDVEPDQSTAD